jgi:hypothetical protein
MLRSIFPSRAAPPPLSAPAAVRLLVPVRAPRSGVCTRRATPTAEFLVNQSAVIGEGIVYFTLFYTTTNWWYYRRTRKDAEAADKNRKNK